MFGVTVAFLAEETDVEDAVEREERDRLRDQDRALYNRLLSSLRTISQQLTSGGGADLSQTSGMVTGVLDRLLEDPAAMLALATIRGVGERTLFHSLNVMIYSLALGGRLGLPEESLPSLGTAALLHDVGKSAFDQGDLAQAERMRALHPKMGAEILQRVSLDDPAPMLAAYEHHMNVDGTGFPQRPADYIAHPYSRMIAVANRYENLTNATARAHGADARPCRAAGPARRRLDARPVLRSALRQRDGRVPGRLPRPALRPVGRSRRTAR